MRLIRLTVSNFKTLRGDKTYDFNEGIIGITGNNGRGKSTIANAIGWTLYGPDILPTGKADVVSWGEDHASCSLLFEMPNGDEWNITREQTAKGVGSAELWNLTTGQRTAFGLDPVNREVVRLLGLDRVGFLISVYARQEELAGIMSLTPANRMKTILRLLGIEQLTAAIDTTRARAREGRKVLDGLRFGLADADELRAEVTKANARLQELGTQEKSENDNLTKITEEHKSIAKQYAALLPQRKEYEEYRSKLSELTFRVRQTGAEHEGAVREAEMPEQAAPGPQPPKVEEALVASLLDDININKHAARRLQDEIDSAIIECQYCHRSFDNAEQVAEHTNDLKLNLAATFDAVDGLSSTYDTARDGLNAYNRWLDKAKAYEDYQAKRKIDAERVRKAAVAHASALMALEALPRVEEPSVALDGLQEQMRELESAGNQIRIRLATLASQRDLYTNLLNHTNNVLEAYIAKQEEIAIQVKQSNNAEIASSELVRLKEKMIAQIIPALSDRSSRLLTEFTEGRYTELVIAPNYEIQYRSDLGELKTFENLSGGERDIFALALRLAIGEIRADNVGVLILDEVLESLDADRQESTWQAIERLTGRYSQIFLVTHIEKYKDRAASVISL